VIVVAVDPGYRESAWLSFDGARVIRHAIEPNEYLLMRFWKDAWSEEGFGAGAYEHKPTCVVFEQIESFGMAVGREVFETVFWTGRLYQAAGRVTTQTKRMPRREVKVHLCQSSRAQDSNIRTALIDRFGGSDAIGKTKSKGPLWGIKSHEWSALAIAVTWYDLHKNDPEEIRPGVAAQFTDESVERPSRGDW
jgi:hypothetical protein